MHVNEGRPISFCPQRCAHYDMLPRWLARIMGFPEALIAPEVPFIRSPTSNRWAGRIDMLVAPDGEASAWFGLEVQAVYF